MTKSLSRHLYTILLWLLLPYVFFHLLWRARKQPEYLKHIGERFGFYNQTRSAKPVIWLHTVSVGETRAAATLVQQLIAAYPGHQILLTHTTPTGRSAGEQLYGGKVLRVYLPYDYPFAVQRFLNHFRPVIGILLETEIWFNLVRLCHRENIPLLLLNARLSDRSARRYLRFSGLTRPALADLAAIVAQTDEDADRFAALGALNVAVMGNLKFDIEPPDDLIQTGFLLRNQLGRERRVFLAASTREGEEPLLLQAIRQVRLHRLLTVIVPRHPQRFEQVASLLAGQGIRFQRRSENRPVDTDTEVILGDSMGELFAYYAACDLAFIGGSLLPFGGQNLIEACALGKPVLIGPHTYNFAQAADQAVATGAAQRVASASEIAEKLEHLFNQPDELEAMARHAKSFVSMHRGATEVAMRVIRAHLPP